MANGMRFKIEELPESVRGQVLAKLGGMPRAVNPYVAAGVRQSESEEQIAFFQRIDEIAAADERYALAVRRTFAIPNGGFRHPAVAGRLKAEGVKRGPADIQCAVPCRHFHGLFIEMKAGHNTTSDEQKTFLRESADLNYIAVVAHGCDRAITVWRSYVEGTFS